MPATFADRLSLAISAFDGGLEQICRAAGVARTSIHNYTTGASQPTLPKVVSLARALGVDPAALAFGDDARPSVHLHLKWVAGKVELQQLDVDPPAAAEPDLDDDAAEDDEPAPANKAKKPKSDTVSDLKSKATKASDKPKGPKLPNWPLPDYFDVAAGRGKVIELDPRIEAEFERGREKEIIARVTGDSMEPTIAKGARVRLELIPDTEVFRPRNPKKFEEPICLVRYKDDDLVVFTLKRVMIKEGVFLAVADNRDCEWGNRGVELLAAGHEPRCVAKFVEVVE